MASVTVVLGDPPYIQKVPDGILRPMRGYGAQLFPELFQHLLTTFKTWNIKAEFVKGFKKFTDVCWFTTLWGG